MTFRGEVDIEIQVDTQTSALVLHALELAFDGGSLRPVGDGQSREARITVDASTQTAKFVFDAPILPGRYRLSARYAGKINTQPMGIFALDYEHDGAKQRALFTQHEAADARRVVPSWDEPNFKATFDLTLIVPADRMAVGNMPIKTERKLAGGLKEVSFGRSPKMSSYLLFFALGDFERKAVMADGVEVGVVTRRGALDKAQYVLDGTRQFLKEYNDYFGVRYPLPKLDTVMGPGQSQVFSAMENWGGIFTLEYIGLVDPRVTTEFEKRSVFETQAHEVAHQWFGNLVTMRWWDDLWLNEGFASWMASRTTRRMHPEWTLELDAMNMRTYAMGRDAIRTTHPIVQRITTAEQTHQAFDAITYVKGQEVIGMLETYVGADAWRQGVRTYMQRHAYGNTVSADLWRAVEEASDVPIVDIANDFTMQPGIPMLAMESSECRDGRTHVTLAQGEFTKDQPGKAPLRWRVPVIAGVLGHPVSRTVVSGGRGGMTLQGCGTVLLNVGQSGYFRTNYSASQIEALGRSFASLPAVDQMGTLDDARALGLALQRPAEDYIKLVQSIPVDAEPAVWNNVAQTLVVLDMYLDGRPMEQDRLRRFIGSRLRPVFDRLGWDDRPTDSANERTLRMTLITALGATGDTELVRGARDRYPSAVSGKLTPELRGAVLDVVAQYADAETWGGLLQNARAEKDAMLRQELYMLLAKARDPALARRVLDVALSGEAGDTGSAPLVSYLSFRHARLAFEFAASHPEWVDRMVDANAKSRYVPELARNGDRDLIEPVQKYAESRLPEDARVPSMTTIADIEYRHSILQGAMPGVDSWLRAQGF